MLANEDIYVESTPPNPNVNPKIVGAYWINKNDGNCYVCKDNSFNKNVWIKVGDYDKQIEEIKTIINSKGGYSLPNFKNPTYVKSLYELYVEYGHQFNPNDNSINFSHAHWYFRLPDLNNNTYFAIASLEESDRRIYPYSRIAGFISKPKIEKIPYAKLTDFRMFYLVNHDKYGVEYGGYTSPHPLVSQLPLLVVNLDYDYYSDRNTVLPPLGRGDLFTPGRYRVVRMGKNLHERWLTQYAIRRIFFIQ